VLNSYLHLHLEDAWVLTTHADEVLDILLDQEGLEIDEPDRMEHDTPLHKAVRYVNSLEKAEWASHGHPIVEILLDAGCDPRSRNKAKLRPMELADPRNLELRSILQKGD
jgi:ankyrin repeat protein